MKVTVHRSLHRGASRSQQRMPWTLPRLRKASLRYSARMHRSRRTIIGCGKKSIRAVQAGFLAILLLPAMGRLMVIPTSARMTHLTKTQLGHEERPSTATLLRTLSDLLLQQYNVPTTVFLLTFLPAIAPLAPCSLIRHGPSAGLNFVRPSIPL
jgi:hypothetical protein